MLKPIPVDKEPDTELESFDNYFQTSDEENDRGSGGAIRFVISGAGIDGATNHGASGRIEGWLLSHSGSAHIGIDNTLASEIGVPMEEISDGKPSDSAGN